MTYIVAGHVNCGNNTQLSRLPLGGGVFVFLVKPSRLIATALWNSVRHLHPLHFASVFSSQPLVCIGLGVADLSSDIKLSSKRWLDISRQCEFDVMFPSFIQVFFPLSR